MLISILAPGTHFTSVLTRHCWSTFRIILAPSSKVLSCFGWLYDCHLALLASLSRVEFSYRSAETCWLTWSHSQTLSFSSLDVVTWWFVNSELSLTTVLVKAQIISFRIVISHMTGSQLHVRDAASWVAIGTNIAAYELVPGWVIVCTSPYVWCNPCRCCCCWTLAVLSVLGGHISSPWLPSGTYSSLSGSPSALRHQVRLTLMYHGLIEPWWE